VVGNYYVTERACHHIVHFLILRFGYSFSAFADLKSILPYKKKQVNSF